MAKIPAEEFENPEFYNKISVSFNTLNGNKCVELIQGSVAVFRSMIECASLVLSITYFSPVIFIICLVSILPVSIARIARGKEFYLFKKYTTGKNRQYRYYAGLIHGTGSNRELRVFNASDYIIKKSIEIKSEIEKEEGKYHKKNAIIQCLTDFTKHAGFGIGIFVVAFLAMGRIISIGTLSVAIYALKNIQDSFSRTIISGGRIANIWAQLFDLVSFWNAPEYKCGDIRLDALNNEIELKNVSFKYLNTETEALRNISLKIKKGEILAIVGVNGSGKSTLVKVLQGIYRPARGEVYYDGIPLKDYAYDSVASNMTCAYQDYIKYQLMLRQNVGFSKLDDINSDEKIINAIKEADFYDTFLTLGDGLNTVLGKMFDGFELSEGQLQKVAIARCIFRNAAIMFFDEPTASIDPIAEAEILSNFVKMTRGKTSILVTHRIGSARLANRIIVMKNGEIVESGTHDELLLRDSEYALLYKAQSQWYV